MCVSVPTLAIYSLLLRISATTAVAPPDTSCSSSFRRSCTFWFWEESWWNDTFWPAKGGVVRKISKENVVSGKERTGGGRKRKESRRNRTIEEEEDQGEEREWDKWLKRRWVIKKALRQDERQMETKGEGGGKNRQEVRWKRRRDEWETQTQKDSEHEIVR